MLGLGLSLTNTNTLSTGDTIYDSTVVSVTRVIRAATRIVDRRQS